MLIRIEELTPVEKNFTLKEFMCHCGCGEVVFDYKVVRALQRMRNYFRAKVLGGRARIDIKVGYRCKKYNQWLINEWKAGRYPNKPAENTWHFRGAVDIHVYIMKSGSSQWVKVPTGEVDRVAKIFGFRGRGIYKTFNHLDMRPVPSFWDNR